MRPVVRLTALGAVISFVVAAPAAAQDGVRPAAKKKDPNQIVCQKEEVLGTRLTTRQVCRTRAEWAEQRRSDRDAVQKAQLGACMKQAGC